MVPPIQNGMSMKKKSTFVCLNIPSAIRPVHHGDGLAVPEPPDNFAMYEGWNFNSGNYLFTTDIK